MLWCHCCAGNLANWLTSKHHPLANRLKLAQDVLKCGMALQQCGLIHGDIRTDNFLVDGEGTALLNDFGMADQAHGLQKGTLREVNHNGRYWMAPEWGTNEAGAANVCYTIQIYSIGIYVAPPLLLLMLLLLSPRVVDGYVRHSPGCHADIGGSTQPHCAHARRY